MKTIVIDRDLLEREIKPHALLGEYRRLISEDVEARLLSPNELQTCRCPGCQAEVGRHGFEKFDLSYLECDACKSVYVSPRPSEQALVEFYRDSTSSQFWRGRILPETREARREKVFRPRAQWLLDVVDRYCPEARLGIVVGYHNDLLVEELTNQEKYPFHMIVTNPIADIEYAGLNLPNVTIRPMRVDALSSFGPADLFLAFDILDRCNDLDGLFAAARKTLTPGGLLLGSTTLISGFDLQVLWDRSDSIYPPERMNLLSTEGLTTLSERHGFEMLEFSTPGTFDVEIVKRAIHANPEFPWPRFIRYLIENRDENALVELQEYLQKNRLSSFARILFRKAC
jgi:hypothetical protein